MVGAGVLTLLAMLLVAPFEIARARAQKRRLLSPHELLLRRASQPAGFVALMLTVLIWLYGVRGVGSGLGTIVVDPASNWPAAVLLGLLLVYGLASFVYGARRCWGMRDGLLATGAFVKLAFGAVVTVYLGRLYPWGQAGATVWGFLAVGAVFLTGVWCLAVGAVRFLLLLAPVRSARGLVGGDIAAGEFQWPSRPRQNRWALWKR